MSLGRMPGGTADWIIFVEQEVSPPGVFSLLTSPRHLVTLGGHLEVCQLLVRYGSDVNSQDNRKVSVLMAAFRKGHGKTVKWLVRHVTQFPSESDTARFISTLSEKVTQEEEPYDIIYKITF